MNYSGFNSLRDIELRVIKTLSKDMNLSIEVSAKIFSELMGGLLNNTIDFLINSFLMIEPSTDDERLYYFHVYTANSPLGQTQPSVYNEIFKLISKCNLYFYNYNSHLGSRRSTTKFQFRLVNNL